MNEIFHAALELSASDREGFVSSASKGDMELEQDVIRLLKADSEAESYLETPAIPVIADIDLYTAPIPFEPGDILKMRFRIERHVGQGGMGHVFEAYDLDLKVRVALKVIRPEIASIPAALEYFRREVRVARTITHVNVCRTYDLDRGNVASESPDSQKLFFLTMEFLEGETLATRIKREGSLAIEDAHSIARQIASGLESAHAAGVIHRDLKPANIMLVPGPDLATVQRVVIMDFGLARRSQIKAASSSAISSGVLIGTLAYMAPEQLDPDTPVSAATDIYAFGLILFEMATGQRAYPATSLLSGIAQRLSGNLPSAKALAPGMPDSWENAIEGCLWPEPKDRFQSAAKVIAMLDGQVTAPPHMANRRATSGITLRASWLHRQWRTIAVAVLVCVSLFAVWFRLYQQRGNSQVTPGTLVYLAPVLNLTGEKALDNATELLQASLSQSVQINLLDHGRVGDALQWMTKPPDATIDAPTAREIAMRVGASRVVLASVTGSGKTRQLNIDIEQPDNSPARARNQWTKTFTWQERNEPSATISPELLSAVRNASEWIRFNAGESKNDIAQLDSPPGDITTVNWNALEQFVHATSLDMKGDAEDAREELSQAVQTDPSFALAYARLADIDYELGQAKDGFTAYQRALDPELSEHLTRRERDRIRGMFAIDTMDFAAADAAFRDYTSFYESDYTGWAYRCYPLMMLNRTGEAIDVLRTAMRLDSHRAFAPEMLARYLLIDGRYDEVWQLIEKIRKLGNSDFANEIQGQLSFLQMDFGQAEQAFTEIARSPNSSRQGDGHVLLARLWAERGEYEKALTELSLSLQSNDARSNPHNAALLRVDIAYVDMQLGRDSESLMNLKAAAAGDSDLYVLFNGMDILDAIAARSPKPRVRQEMESVLTLVARSIHPDEQSVADTILRARTGATKALLQGNAVKAEKAFREADRLMAPAVPRTSYAVFHLAAARQADDVRERDQAKSLALEAYKTAAARPEFVWGRPLQFPPGYYLANAQAYLRLAKELRRYDTNTRACEERVSKSLLPEASALRR